VAVVLVAQLAFVPTVSAEGSRGPPQLPGERWVAEAAAARMLNLSFAARRGSASSRRAAGAQVDQRFTNSLVGAAKPSSRCALSLIRGGVRKPTETVRRLAAR
jgi:hypothetical protein